MIFPFKWGTIALHLFKFSMSRYRIWSVILIILAVLVGWFIYTSQKPGARFPFKLGLDLAGGTELVYKADAIKQEPYYRDASLYKVHPDGLDTLLHEP